MKNPNILVLFSDQQRWDTLGCCNSSIDFTPNIDRLAAEGLRCGNAFTCQPVCCPARACLQTGLYATQTGCYRNGIPLTLPQGVPTLAEQFRQNGYETAYIGKWHLSNTGAQPVPAALRGGYRDHWLAVDTLEFSSTGVSGGFMFDGDGRRVEFGGYRVDTQTDLVLDYLQNRDSNKPFFLFVSYLEPHHQNDAGHYQGPEGSKEKYAHYPVPEDLRQLGGGDWAEEYPDYLGCCASLDENVGRIVDTLKALGVYENTLIAYTSDHGSHFKTRNGEYKRCCHDGCTHIPMILRGPGFTGGTATDEMVSLVDLPITLLHAGGIAAPRGIQGNPLQRLANGETEDWPEDVFIQISETHVGRALRTKKWKYAVKGLRRNGWLHADAKAYKEEFLYDLENDPHELRNLVRRAGYDEVRAGLRARLLERMVEAGEQAPVIKGI